MGTEIGLMATAYTLAWLAVLGGAAWFGYKLSQPKQNEIRVSSGESIRNYRPPSGKSVR